MEFTSAVKASKNVLETSLKHQKRVRTVSGLFLVRFGQFSNRSASFWNRSARCSHSFFRFVCIVVVARLFPSIVVIVAAAVLVAVEVVDVVVIDIVVVGRRR